MWHSGGMLWGQGTVQCVPVGGFAWSPCLLAVTAAHSISLSQVPVRNMSDTKVQAMISMLLKTYYSAWRTVKS